MENFLITISFLHPYPIKNEFREAASNFAPAIGRAIRKWRKENERKKIKEITIKAIRL
jgi:hypothetical protein